MKVKFTVELVNAIITAVKGITVEPGDHQDVLINGIPLVIEINNDYPQSNPRLVITYGKMFIINEDYIKFLDFPRLEVSVEKALMCLGSKQVGLSEQYVWKKINDTVEYQRYTDPANRTFDIKFPNNISFVKALDGIEVSVSRETGFHTLKPQSTKLFSLTASNPTIIDQGMALAVSALTSYPIPVVFEPREVDLDLVTSIVNGQLLALKDGSIKSYFENDLREQMENLTFEATQYPYRMQALQQGYNQPLFSNPGLNNPGFNPQELRQAMFTNPGTNVYGSGFFSGPGVGDSPKRY